MPRASGAVLLPAPVQQKTPWQSGEDAAWQWSLPDGERASPRATLPAQQHRRRTAHDQHAPAPAAAMASITASLARDHRRLSAHLDAWVSMLRQRSGGQEAAAAPGAQPERQGLRRKHADDGRRLAEGEAQRPARPALHGALRGGGGGGNGQPAACRDQQGNNLRSDSQTPSKAGIGAWLDRRRRDAAAAARQMPFWLVLHPPGHPDKRRLMTVHDFYEYTEKKGVLSGVPLAHRRHETHALASAHGTCGPGSPNLLPRPELANTDDTICVSIGCCQSFRSHTCHQCECMPVSACDLVTTRRCCSWPQQDVSTSTASTATAMGASAWTT